MGIFDLLNKKAIISTFQNDFDKIRTADHAIQIAVAQKVFTEIDDIRKLSLDNLNQLRPQLLTKYKNLRNDSLKNGATNELDPDYAYAALLESLMLSMGNDEVFGKIMNDLMGWFSLLGVIKRS
jgi:hypothetical protein